VVDALVKRCDKHVVSSHIKTSLTEVVEESIPAHPVVVECIPEGVVTSMRLVEEEEEFLAELECLRTSEASCKNSE
jgi:hypothetical protein